MGSTSPRIQQPIQKQRRTHIAYHALLMAGQKYANIEENLTESEEALLMAQEMKEAAHAWNKAAHERRYSKLENVEDKAGQSELMMRVRSFVKLRMQRRCARPSAAGDASLHLLVNGNNNTAVKHY